MPVEGDPSVGCPVLHVDMDAFYASVATRDRPDLRDVPVIVGGGQRGVVLSANYLARQDGVRSAQPMAQARRLCPRAVVLAPDFALFSRVSDSVMETFRAVTPVVEVASLDEAYLDVRGAGRRLGTPLQVAEQLRATVHDEQGITCSVGVAASTAVAKVASRRAKPDGVLVVPPDQVVDFLHPLDVGELWGVGPRTRDRLHRAGLVTVGDLAGAPTATVGRAVGPGHARHLQELARGGGRRSVATGRAPAADRSMGADETFGSDTDDPAVVRRELLRLTARLTGRMRAAGVAGRTVTLRVRLADFTTLTRSRTLPEATDTTQDVYRVVVGLHDALGPQRLRVRLVGVRVEHLVRGSRVHRQLVLGEREHGWADADRAVDLAVSRFGSAAVRPATLLGEHGRRLA